MSGLIPQPGKLKVLLLHVYNVQLLYESHNNGQNCVYYTQDFTVYCCLLAGLLAYINLPCLGDLHLQTTPPSCQQHTVVNREKSYMLIKSPPHILYQQPSDPQLNVV